MLADMFAEKAVNVSKLPAFRAEHFPYVGPYPWLDRPDALVRIEEKLRAGEITASEAEQCRHWHANGYIVLEKLFDDETLTAVWDSYERPSWSRPSLIVCQRRDVRKKVRCHRCAGPGTAVVANAPDRPIGDCRLDLLSSFRIRWRRAPFLLFSFVGSLRELNAKRNTWVGQLCCLPKVAATSRTSSQTVVSLPCLGPISKTALLSVAA
jgi:hypothetical protein